MSRFVSLQTTLGPGRATGAALPTDLGQLIQQAAREALDAERSGARAVNTPGALVYLQNHGRMLRASGRAQEADRINQQLQQALAALLAAESSQVGGFPGEEPLPPHLRQVAEQAAQETARLIANGSARRRGPGIDFYFPRDNQPRSLVHLVQQINSFTQQGRAGWALAMEDLFTQALGGR